MSVQDILEPVYEQRKRTRYRIVRIRSRAPIQAAIACTYFAHRPSARQTLNRVRNRIAAVNRLFLERVWNLGRYELWLYQRGLSPNPSELEPERLVSAFELLARCASRCVIYARPPKNHRPCNRANFCPHCWASSAARQYQRIRCVINSLTSRTAERGVTLTVQTTEVPLTSCGIGGDGFSTPEERYAAILNLRSAIERCKTHVQRFQKSTQRNTLGSIWRVVVIPAEAGWRLQLRQLFLTDADKQPPTTPMPRSQTVYREQLHLHAGLSWGDRRQKHSQYAAAYELLVQFNLYPLEWLTHDVELTAIYLNAAARTRLLGGTGKLKKIGSSLVRAYVRAEAQQNNVRPRAL